MRQFNIVQEDLKKLRFQLKETGFAFLETRATPSYCEYVKSFIDRFPDKDSENNYGGSEKRIWDSQIKNTIINEFADLSSEVIGDVLNVRPTLRTVLSYRNNPVESTGMYIQGRWHLDSLRNQYKLFCFLTDVNELSGPLELIPGTQSMFFKLRPLLSGQYISYDDLWTGGRRYQHLDEQWINDSCLKPIGSLPLLCKAGSMVLVDTSAVHRARPCLKYDRYALCAYYEHF